MADEETAETAETDATDATDATSRTANGGGARPRLHGDMLTTSVLAFLRTSSAYGYQLTRMLEDAGLPDFDSGSVYRTLRQLERSGMVSSFWDTSESGPARRMYSMTSAGELFLRGWIDVIDRYQAVLQQAVDVLGDEPRPEDEPDSARSANGTGTGAGAS